ncbi:uncharacterized protein LOC110614923 [Manihot esculenta]|uniref:Bet v I/Major latex protein domain-containing protein n=1 Tax=Manihot esculenta TaxID=3983 RepID=A0A2C9VW32_MANES|nr:uncharacterized protein LOC110614923 [Manihot esculenta]OAY49861.1 hypothetical protein MANES_05G089800v8 [Manihot esculenta]
MSIVSGEGGVVVKIRTNPDVFWNHIQHSKKYFPKAAKTLYSSITSDSKKCNVRYVTYGPRAENIKNSTEIITKNDGGEFAYTVTGDILTKFSLTEFKAVIRYPRGGWVSWTWTYKYSSNDEEDAISVDKEMSEIATETLAKVDYYVQSESANFAAAAKLQAQAS